MVTYHFNKAQLPFVMSDAIEAIALEFVDICPDDSVDLDVLVVEFPYKFCIRTRRYDCFVLWNSRKCIYEQLPKERVRRPQPEPEP